MDVQQAPAMVTGMPYLAIAVVVVVVLILLFVLWRR